MSEAKENKEQQIVSKPQPIVMSMDFLHNPIFIPGREVPLESEYSFLVDGKVRTKITGGYLNADAADVFHALTHLSKQNGFPRARLNFRMGDLLRQLNLAPEGKNYLRIKRAIDALYSVSIEIESVNKKIGKGSGGWRIITERFVYEKGDGAARLQSWIKFSDPILESFRSGALKAVHPAYFELSEAIDKRIFSLLSVRASDLKEWRISVLTFRDLIPLLAGKARTPSGAKQQLEGSLRRLKEKGVLFDYEFFKSEAREPSILMRRNPDYFFFSGPESTKSFALSTKPTKERKTLARVDKKNPLVETLMSKGFDVKEATKLLRSYSSETIETQLAHLEYLEKHSGPRENPAGFLVASLQKGYSPPLSMVKKAEEEKNLKINRLIEQAENHAQHSDNEKRLQLAITSLEEAEKLGASTSRLSKIAEKVKHQLGLLTDSGYAQAFEGKLEEDKKKANELIANFHEQVERNEQEAKIMKLLEDARNHVSQSSASSLVFAAEALEKAVKAGAKPKEANPITLAIKKKAKELSLIKEL